MCGLVRACVHACVQLVPHYADDVCPGLDVGGRRQLSQICLQERDGKSVNRRPPNSHAHSQQAHCRPPPTVHGTAQLTTVIGYAVRRAHACTAIARKIKRATLVLTYGNTAASTSNRNRFCLLGLLGFWEGSSCLPLLVRSRSLSLRVPTGTRTRT